MLRFSDAATARVPHVVGHHTVQAACLAVLPLLTAGEARGQDEPGQLPRGLAWNEQSASIGLQLLAPEGSTWWAYLAIAVMAAALVFWFVRVRTRHLEARNRELETTVREKSIELEQRVEELAVINSVQRGLVDELDMQGIYDLVGDRVRDLFDAQVVVIRTYDHEAGLEYFRYTIEKGERLHIPTKPFDDFARHLIETRRPILINERFEDYIRPYSDEASLEGEVPRSALFVPMMVGGIVRGNVSLQNVDREHAFTQDDVRLLTTLANSMSVALENARLFAETSRLLEETEQRAAELAVINGVQEGLVAELDMQAIYDLVGDRIRDLFDAQAVVIATVDEAAGVEHFRYHFEKGETTRPSPRSLDTIRQRLIETREPILINSDFVGALVEMGYDRPEPLPGTAMPRSVMFVPLIVGEVVKGYVSLQNVDREHAFTENDVRLLSTLANSMSVALENARLFAETRQQAAELETVNRVSRALVAQLDFDALVHLVGERMRQTFQADIAYVALLDQETGVINFPYVYGEELSPMAYGEGLTSEIIRTREPLLINENVQGRAQELGIRQVGKQSASYLGVPIQAGDEALGVISVQSTEQENVFDEDDLRLLNTIAANVGVALQNAEAYRRLGEALAELKTMQEQLVHQEKLASLGALTAGIAHEIKNPLNFITNFAELNEELADELREDLADYPEALEQVDDLLHDLRENSARIKQHGRRADGIVRSMMAHARTGRGEREEVDLNALVDEHVELAYHGKRAQTPGFPVDIDRDYDPAVGKAEVVPQELGRVILNLVSNAFDAVSETATRQNGQDAPRVSVATRKKGNQVEIRVADNGSGIPDSVRTKIFEPFFTTKPAGAGTGLGLSMSHDIITRGHGGTLTLNTAEGRGTTFIITIPATRVLPPEPTGPQNHLTTR